MNNRLLAIFAAISATSIFGLNHTITKTLMPVYITPSGLSCFFNSVSPHLAHISTRSVIFTSAGFPQLMHLDLCVIDIAFSYSDVPMWEQSPLLFFVSSVRTDTFLVSYYLRSVRRIRQRFSWWVFGHQTSSSVTIAVLHRKPCHLNHPCLANHYSRRNPT